MKLLTKTPEILYAFAETVEDDEYGTAMGRLSIGLPKELFIQKLDQFYDGETNILVAAYDEEKNQIGGFVLMETNRSNRRVEMHHIIFPEYRGKFYLRLHAAIMKFAFLELRMENVYGMFSETNKQKATNLMKLGWEEVAMLPQYFCTHKGLEDAYVYRLSSKNWRTR